MKRGAPCLVVFETCEPPTPAQCVLGGAAAAVPPKVRSSGKFFFNPTIGSLATPRSGLTPSASTFAEAYPALTCQAIDVPPLSGLVPNGGFSLECVAR